MSKMVEFQQYESPGYAEQGEPHAVHINPLLVRRAVEFVGAKPRQTVIYFEGDDRIVVLGAPYDVSRLLTEGLRDVEY